MERISLMRRVLLAGALAGALLTSAAACGSDKPETPAAAPASPTPTAEPTVQATTTSPNTRQVCGKVTALYDDGFDGFNAAMGRMIANKEAKLAPEAKKAQGVAAGELKKVGTRLKREIAAAEDPELKAAGEASAAKLTKSATDKKFFDSIKTTADLNKQIEGKMLDWMTPVRGFCA